MSQRSATRAWAPSGLTWSIRVTRPDAHSVSPHPDLHTLDDHTLAARATGGSRDAFDVIVERHGRVVYEVCYRFVQNHEDAADLARGHVRARLARLARFKTEAALSTPALPHRGRCICLTRVGAKAVPSRPSPTSISSRTRRPSCRAPA
ncbi:MAG: hypothetical protein R2712_27665 [Vicinamibacterales bacterium]